MVNCEWSPNAELRHESVRMVNGNGDGERLTAHGESERNTEMWTESGDRERRSVNGERQTGTANGERIRRTKNEERTVDRGRRSGAVLKPFQSAVGAVGTGRVKAIGPRVSASTDLPPPLHPTPRDRAEARPGGRRVVGSPALGSEGGQVELTEGR